MKWPAINHLPLPPSVRCTSVIQDHPGSEEVTKTPTDFCASISPKALTYPSTPKKDLEFVALQLNDRPRATLGFFKPVEEMAELLDYATEI